MLELISNNELFNAQSIDAFCTKTWQTLNACEFILFLTGEDGVLCLTAEAGPQIVLPHSLKGLFLYSSSHSQLSAHLDVRKMYYLLHRQFHWPPLAVDCYTTMHRCTSCAMEPPSWHVLISRLSCFWEHLHIRVSLSMYSAGSSPQSQERCSYFSLQTSSSNWYGSYTWRGSSRTKSPNN